MADAIVAKGGPCRNIVPPDMAEGVREASLGVWTRKTADGLETRADLVKMAYAMKPETLVGAKNGASREVELSA
jgi:hypothetical protein